MFHDTCNIRIEILSEKEEHIACVGYSVENLLTCFAIVIWMRSIHELITVDAYNVVSFDFIIFSLTMNLLVMYVYPHS